MEAERPAVSLQVYEEIGKSQKTPVFGKPTLGANEVQTACYCSMQMTNYLYP